MRRRFSKCGSSSTSEGDGEGSQSPLPHRQLPTSGDIDRDIDRDRDMDRGHPERGEKTPSDTTRSSATHIASAGNARCIGLQEGNGYEDEDGSLDASLASMDIGTSSGSGIRVFSTDSLETEHPLNVTVEEEAARPESTETAGDQFLSDNPSLTFHRISVQSMQGHREKDTIVSPFSVRQSPAIMQMPQHYSSSSDRGLSSPATVSRLFSSSTSNDFDPLFPPPGEQDVLLLPRTEIERATQNYSVELGAEAGGAMGSPSPSPSPDSRQHSPALYRGTFRGMSIVVRRYNSHQRANAMVNRLVGNSSGIRDLAHQRFMAELQVLSTCRHANLLPAIAFCMDPSCVAVVYPLSDRGSLQDAFSQRAVRGFFDATARLNIALALCSVFAYLHCKDEHSGKDFIVTHRNLRPVKIIVPGLLGNSVRLSGMDLASVSYDGCDGSGCESNGSPESSMSIDCLTLIASTCTGYIDPLYNETGEINALSDVYSFGVVLLQLITGAPATSDPTQRPPGLVARVRAQSRGGGRVAEEGVWAGSGMEKELLDFAFKCLSLSTSERPQHGGQLLELFSQIPAVSNLSRMKMI